MTRNSLLTTSVVVLALSSISSSLEANETWFQSPITNQWYARSIYAFSWDDGEKYAQTFGGHLTTIRTAQENTWLTAQFGGNVWIGYNDATTEGQWAWASGDTASYTNWNPGEPNDVGGEDHATMLPGGKWNDDGGSKLKSVIIEVPVGPPGPSDPGDLVDDWILSPHSGLWYARTLVGMDHPTAVALAASVGGFIGTVHNLAENGWIVSTFSTGGNPLWIGLTDEANEGTWVWDSGESSSFTNWAAGEPNNSGGEDFVTVKSDGKWNDIGIGSSYAAVLMTTNPPNVSIHGDGCAGTGGAVPSLAIATGMVQGGHPISIVVSEGVGGGDALFFVSSTTGQTFVGGGCTLNIGPPFPFVIGPLALSGQAGAAGGGNISLFLTLPLVPSELTVAMQAFVIDPNVPTGFSNTNGLVLKIQP